MAGKSGSRKGEGVGQVVRADESNRERAVELAMSQI